MKAESLMLITDARTVLLNTAITDARQNPLVAAFLGWLLQRDDLLALLEEAAIRAAAAKGAERTSRNVAVLGFACAVETLKTRFAAEFVAQLEWSIGRPNFATGGEPCGVVADPLNFAGVVAGAECALGKEIRKRFGQWSAKVWNDADGLVQNGGWRRGLLDFLGHRIAVAKATTKNDNQPVWLAAALHRRGWSAPAEKSVSDVLKTALDDVSNVTDGFEAGLRLAAIDWAVQRAMDFDIAALTLTDVAAVLHRVPAVFQRWTWENKPRTSRTGAEPRRWHIENEYHFQSLLYAILKPLIPALEEEQYLPPTGTYQPRADLCILGMELVVEVKFWYRGKSVKDLTEEIAADLTLYLRKDSPYRMVIAAIWDDGARTEEQAELKRGLKGLTGLADVVIVNRPSCMNIAPVPVSTEKRKKKP
ncbi:MAG TPA: hypothetical protein VMF08_01820 [Candidatus Sulfotelmatobacter sp.]|nr:hypothetical protein [Candidatus Sulfotelmatobacter sp.]